MVAILYFFFTQTHQLILQAPTKKKKSPTNTCQSHESTMKTPPPTSLGQAMAMNTETGFTGRPGVSESRLRLTTQVPRQGGSAYLPRSRYARRGGSQHNLASLSLHPCLFQTKKILTFQVEMGWGWRDSISTIAVLYTVYRLSSKCTKTDMIHWYIYTYICVCDMISFCNHCFNSGHSSIAPSSSTYVFQWIGPQHPQTSPNLPPVSRERNSTIRSSGANATPGMKSKHSLKAACWLGK